MANLTNIPAPRVDFIDPRTGLMAREWYRFFLNLFVLTGSGTNSISLDDVQVGPVQSSESSQVERLAKYNRTLQWLTMGH